MSFDEQLRRAFDAAIAEITDAARADRDRARDQALEDGRAQGWEDGREHGRFEGKQEAEDEFRKTPPPAPVTIDSGASLARALDGVRAIDGAGSLSGILDAIAAYAVGDAGRAAVFVVRGEQLHGWRFTGFDTNASPVVVDKTDAGVLAESIQNRGVSRSDDIPPFAIPGAGPALAAPVDIADETVAVVYADGDVNAQGVELLARHAGRALEAIVALKAARFVTEPPAGAALASPGSHAASTHDADDADSSARRYAKLLVSEIKLYHEPEVVAGRRDRDLGSRLGGEIARARVLYEQRVPSDVRQRTDYFHDELVRTLANGDPSLLSLT